MPHKKKKSFIDKKKSVTFHLVHRSQRDPLAADETAPQRVLLPAEKVETEKRREEQRNFGVFFDDDYNYLQHLKEVGPAELVPSDTYRAPRRIIVTNDGKVEEEEPIPAPTLQLPSSVFASQFEEDVGLLNKAAPVRGLCLDLDPDVVAALDDDFDFENPDNQLDDDFILHANNPGSEAPSKYDGEEEEEDDDDDNDNDDDFDSEGPLSDEEDEGDFGPMKECLFMQEETRSRFTEYSMSCAAMRRNEHLTLLDERFEKFYEQYDEDEIGALDNREMEGYIQPDSERLQALVDDYFKEKAKECVSLKDLEQQRKEFYNPEPRGRLDKTEQTGGLEKIEDTEELDGVVEDEEEEEKMETIVIELPSKWNCESILSTYSNLYNHPFTIVDPPKKKPIKVSTRTGIPLGVLPERGPTAKQVERMERINDGDLPRVSTQPRCKNESKEEKKTRKQAVKQERKERRMEKKANQLAFKHEKDRQVKEQQNLQQNLQGLKLS